MRTVLLALVLALAACGGSDRRPAPPPVTHGSWWVDTGQGFVTGIAWQCPDQAAPAIVAEIRSEVEQAGRRVLQAGRSTTCLQGFRVLILPGVQPTAANAPDGRVMVACEGLGAIEHELAMHGCAFRLGCSNWKVIGHDGLGLEHCR